MVVAQDVESHLYCEDCAGLLRAIETDLVAGASLEYR